MSSDVAPSALCINDTTFLLRMGGVEAHMVAIYSTFETL
jgi:hypothetical protein